MLASTMSSDGNNPHSPRRGDRVAVSAEVNIRRSGFHGFRVQIFDLSPEGCRMEFVEIPAVGERVWVKFQDLAPLEATVRWVDGHYGGVQFERPIYEPIFRRLIG